MKSLLNFCYHLGNRVAALFYRLVIAFSIMLMAPAVVWVMLWAIVILLAAKAISVARWEAFRRSLTMAEPKG